MSKEDMDAISARANRRIILFCIVFFAIATPLSVFLSRKYVTPILAGIDAVKQGASKTNIPEIDDLIEFLDEQERRPATPMRPSPPTCPPITPSSGTSARSRGPKA